MSTHSPHRHDHDHDEPHDRGLQFDLSTLVQRRHLLKMLSGGALITLVGCGSESDPAPAASPASATPAASGTTAAATAATGTSTAGNATVTQTTPAATSTPTTLVSPIPTTATPLSGCTGALPEETAGPYPGDGSNGPNALAQSGIVRNDIRASLDGGTVAEGIPLTTILTVVDTANGCAPLAGAAVYLWYCDREGRYSMYSQGVTQETYLRGVAEADANGVVTFTGIFPGCYAGRWPHIHFEVYPSLAVATSSANKRATSQLAFPEDVCDAVYATTGYEQSVRNLAQLSLDTDNVFRDGWDLQLATMTGDVTQGYTASLLVGV